MDIYDDQSVALILFTAITLWLMYLSRIYYAAKIKGEGEAASSEMKESDTAEE